MIGRLAVSLRRGEIALAVLLLAFGAAVVRGAVQMPPGTMGAPGPGFVPGVLGALLVLAALGLVVRGLRLPRVGYQNVDLGHRHIALTFIALVVLGLVLEPLGYVLSATLFMLVMLGALSPLGWLRSLLAAAVSAGVSYWFFVKLLGVALPAGVLALS